MQDKASAQITISKAWRETRNKWTELVLELPNGDRYIYTMLLGTTADHGQVSEKTNPTFEQRRTATPAELNQMRRIYNEYCKKAQK